MTLLNPLLAFGAVALLVPLLIHIFNRSRFRTIEWGAMHLLESVISQNRRRFRIDQLILLLIRCLIPAVLAACLARPVITGTGLLGNAPVGLVLLLDNSYSMEATDPAGTRFSAAVDSACQVLAGLPRGSQVSVVLTGGRPTLLFDRPLTDVQAVLRRLRQLRPGFGGSDVAGSLQLGMEQLQNIPAVRKQLLVLSDLQAGDWVALTKGSATALQKQLQAGPVPTELLVLPVVSTQQQAADNLAVESVELPQQPVGVGQEFFVRTRLRSYAAKDFNTTEVSLTLDGQPVSTVQTAVKAGGTADVLFRCRSEASGSHVVTAAVSADDLLETDNQRSAALEILNSVPVLLVDGDPGTQPLQGETDYLSVALTPWTYGRVPLTDLLQTQVVPPAQLTEPLLQTARVVVLANVPKLSDQQLEWLSSWVRGGGALLVTAGNRLDLDWHRTKLWNAGNGLLPAVWGELRGVGSDGASAGAASASASAAAAGPAARAARIVSQRSEHPALAFFNDPSNGDLSTAEIRRWHVLTVAPPAATAAEQPDVTASVSIPAVAAVLDTGDPLLLERRSGDGVVLQLATAVDTDWSDLPLRPFYVPLMQQLMTTLAVQIQPPRNVLAGAPAVALFAPAEDSAATADTGPTTSTQPLPTITLQDPLGARSGLSARQQGRWLLAESTATQRPGIYTMTLPDGLPRHFAVQTDGSESDLRLLDSGQQQAAVEQLGGQLLKSVQDYLETDRRRRHGQEIWPLLLAGLLGLLALEVLLQQRFAGVVR
ncbi:MAG: VWA domain-containing protein [Planctomycetaceae bacterium]